MLFQSKADNSSCRHPAKKKETKQNTRPLNLIIYWQSNTQFSATRRDATQTCKFRSWRATTEVFTQPRVSASQGQGPGTCPTHSQRSVQIWGPDCYSMQMRRLKVHHILMGFSKRSILFFGHVRHALWVERVKKGQWWRVIFLCSSRGGTLRIKFSGAFVN